MPPVIRACAAIRMRNCTLTPSSKFSRQPDDRPLKWMPVERVRRRINRPVTVRKYPGDRTPVGIHAAPEPLCSGRRCGHRALRGPSHADTFGTARRLLDEPVSDLTSGEPRFIGISVGRIEAVNGRIVDGTQRDYADRVADAGGIPFQILGRPGSTTLVSRADGILFTGGGDMDPAQYGAEPAPETAGTDTVRDQAEIALLAEAETAGLPILAVCRGIQLLNVARGARSCKTYRTSRTNPIW